MTHFLNAYPTPNQIRSVDYEYEILKTLNATLIDKGVWGDNNFFEKLYVTLRSSLSLLLVAPAQTGKLAIINRVGELLTETPAWHFQKMVGHAFWASGSRNVTLFVDAQMQFNLQNLLNFLEEASQPENENRLFIACLSRISPAEIDALFCIPGFRFFQNADIIPYPPNFRLIGTIDATRFRWWSRELLLQTAVLHWPNLISNDSPKLLSSMQTRLQGASTTFMQTCIRNEQIAYARLLAFLGNRNFFAPIMSMVNVLRKHQIDLPSDAINQAIIFGANAWTLNGNGIFAESICENLTRALDNALAQFILPWMIISECDNVSICQQLQPLLIQHEFKQSLLFLKTI